jgi:hypothetical protein
MPEPITTLVRPGEAIIATRYPDFLATGGIDYSGTITCLHRSHDLEIWKKAAGTCWQGRGSPTQYVPVELWLVQIEQRSRDPQGHEQVVARVIEAVQPGRRKSEFPRLVGEVYRRNHIRRSTKKEPA